MASNGILIVYIALAALHSQVTVISSPLPSSLVVSSIPFYSPVCQTVLSTLLVCLYLCPPFSLSLPSLVLLLLLFLFSLLFKGLDGGQVRASTALCSTEGSVPPCAKVMLGSHIVFYE